MEIQHRKSVTSTNDWAREYAASGAPLPMAFVADTQTAGRGQRSNTWDSPIGWTYLSIALPPAGEPAIDLPLQVAQVVRDVLDTRCDANDSFRVKPPNDVYRTASDGADEKIAGILVEQAKDALIIGIGIDYPPGEFVTEIIEAFEQHGR